MGNSCVQTDDKYKADASNYIDGIKMCDGNKVMKVSEYTGTSGSIFRWVEELNCAGTLKPNCVGDQL